MTQKKQVAGIFVVAVSVEALIMILLHRVSLTHFQESLLDSLLLGSVLAAYMIFQIARESAGREKAELDLAGAESRFQGLVEQSLVGICIVQDGRIAYTNPQFGRIFTCSPAEAVSREVLDFVVPEDRALVAEQIRRRLTGEAKTVHYEFRGLRKDGSTVAIELFGSVTLHGGRPAVIGSLLDISARVSAEKESARDADIQASLNSLLSVSLSEGGLPEVLERALTLLLSMPWLSLESKGAILLADEDGKSLRMTAQMGLSEFVRSSCAKVPFGECLCGKAAQTGRTVYSSHLVAEHSVSYPGMSDHGHYCVPIKLRGKVLGVINLYLAPGHIENAKETSFLEAAGQVIASLIEHQKLDASLQQSQKMEAVGKLAGGVAHDFNNLLTSILGYSGFLIDSLTEGDTRREDALEIKKTAERAADLTRQLLAFSRRQPLLLADVDLNAVVEDSLKLLRRLLGEAVEVRSIPCQGRPVARVDQGQML
ncbi:MAG: PAS domain S-box protein [Elusimicrobia bacterium]|nr:PAS domain S-box protein [Elusimicrobiota bacterium]